MYKQFRNVLAVAACLAMFGSAVHAAEGNNPSRPFEKPLKAVQESMQARKYDEALAKLSEARALPNPTAYDTYVINEFAGVAYANKQKYPEAYEALKANADSPFLAKKGDRQHQLATLAYALKNYAAAVEHCTKVDQEGAGDDQSSLILMQANYQLGKNKEAGVTAKQMIDADEKAGRKPDKIALQILFQTQGKLNDNKGQGQTLEKMLRFYPTPDTWVRAIAGLKDQADKSRNERLTLQVYRLMEEVGALKSWPQYNEMAQLAAGQGFPGESQRVLEAALISAKERIAVRMSEIK
jgi:tetratricopeptide (TPR) repeat protein